VSRREVVEEACLSGECQRCCDDSGDSRFADGVVNDCLHSWKHRDRTIREDARVLRKCHCSGECPFKRNIVAKKKQRHLSKVSFNKRYAGVENKNLYSVPSSGIGLLRDAKCSLCSLGFGAGRRRSKFSHAGNLEAVGPQVSVLSIYGVESWYTIIL